MVRVTVKRAGQAACAFEIATTAELLEKVDKSRHFFPGGTLEDAQGVVLGSSYLLEEGMEFDWFPPAQGAASSSGQAGAGAGAAAALMSQVEYLQVPMNDIMYQGGLTSSGTCTDPRTFELSRWELDHADIHRLLATSLGGKTIRPTDMPSQSAEMLTSEAQTNDVFNRSACDRINHVYAANGVPLKYKLNPASQPDDLFPDFVLGDPMRPSEPGVMVGEGKFPSVLDVGTLLDAVLRLRKLKKQGNEKAPAGLRQSQGCAVEQECNYMKSREARYGFLTCHRYTYFLKYMGLNHYAITDPYLATRTNPSVPAILYYLCEKSRAEGRVKDDEASAAAAAAPAGSSDGDAGSSDPGPSDSRPAKVPRRQSQHGGGVQGGNQRSGDPPAAATCSSTPCMIPDGALILGDRLGEGLCGTVRLARLFGQEVALKRVDACNASHLIPHLQREAAVLSGRLQSLQGVCIPILHAHGHCSGGLVAVLATSVVYGRHPKAGQESASAKASAEQALQEIHARGVAHGDIREENILVDDDDKVWFIDFGSSILDPATHVRTMELEELRLIFTASSSPNSDKTAHKHY